MTRKRPLKVESVETRHIHIKHETNGARVCLALEISFGGGERQNWRDQNREDWQQHRGEMWDYRYDRADQVWDNARDFYDDCFDDRWWGRGGWGYGSAYPYPVNPWWWWRPITWAATTSFLYATAPAPVYVDYGNTVVYEGETVYVDKETQNVAWRIGDNKQTVLTTTLANLTQDVSTVAIHFSGGRVQT